MIISLVVAASENNVIGRDNRLIWKLPNDMSFFRNITWGMPVIMGRKTFESMNAALKGRTNIIVTRQKDYSVAGAPEPGAPAIVIASSLKEAIREAEKTDAKECFVIGGGEIYREAIRVADKIYMTRVLTTVDGDTHFVDIDESSWTLVNSRSFDADEKHAYPYRFEIWQRK